MEEIKELDNAKEIFELSNSWERKGMEKRIEKGIEKGIEKRKMEERQNIAKELLKQGSPVEFVAKVTHLSKEQVEELKEKL
ncbi:RpnC/YadD family protein [Oceanobacillus caeni]